MTLKIIAQRAIINRQIIFQKLMSLGISLNSNNESRKIITNILREALQSGQKEILNRFIKGGALAGPSTVHSLSFLHDQIIRIIYDFSINQDFLKGLSQQPLISIIAVGGYGRGELCPQSDIDLLFLLPSKKSKEAEQLVEFILYILWDLGLKVGHATRSLNECIKLAKLDLTICTALLEARWVWGDQKLFKKMVGKYRKEVTFGTAKKFIHDKLAERDARHSKLGEARYVLEPNIKEGKGGLRDLHTLYWLIKYIYSFYDITELVEKNILTQEVASRFTKAQAFLWTVRCHLHFINNRPDDRLSFSMQSEIAHRMKYADRSGSSGVERFMKHYYLIAKDVGALTRIVCAILEENHKTWLRLSVFNHRKMIEGFKIDNNRLNFSKSTQLSNEPILMLKIFRVSLDKSLDLHPEALSQITKNLKYIGRSLRQNAKVNELFIEILTSKKNPETTLRHMNESGVLGRFIPDFGRVIAQMQYDMYHIYTVDEHTVHAIGILNRIESGELINDFPLEHEIIKTIESRRALYISLFLHDIAKGRNGNHSILGEQVALKLGPRFGLSAEETETISWLVLNHLLMTQTAFKRDVSDPRTISDFIWVVQSPERLKLLMLLTVADVRAVGPNVWNHWKGSLLHELYNRTIETMTGEMAFSSRDVRIKAIQETLAKKLLKEDWSETEIQNYFKKGYPAYWTSFTIERLFYHAELLRNSEKTNKALTIDWIILPDQNITELTLYVADHSGLFSNITGAIALSGASVLDAKITTMSNGMALDSFIIQDTKGFAFNNPERLKKLCLNIELAVSGKLRLDKELAEKRRIALDKSNIFTVLPRVVINNKASAKSTVIEVHGINRIGLLYDITSLITRLGLQILSAHISTYGERVVDVFYVKNVFGMKVENDRKLKSLKDGITKILSIGAPDLPDTNLLFSEIKQNSEMIL